MKTNLTMKYRPLILIIASLLLGGALFAQNPYTIYPIPQEQIALKGSVSFTPAVSVVAEDGIDIYTRDRVVQILQEHGLKADFVQKPQKGNSAIYLGISFYTFEWHRTWIIWPVAGVLFAACKGIYYFVVSKKQPE